MDFNTIKNAPTDELFDMVLEAYYSEKNQQRVNHPKKFRLCTGIGRPVWAEAFGWKTNEYFENPELCLRSQLQWKLFNYYILDEDNYMDLLFGMDFATAYEASLFGMDYRIVEGFEPAFGNPILTGEEIDLSRLEKPDFYKSGLMPRTLEMYKGIKELVKDRGQVYLQGWGRGCWSVAMELRGFASVLEDSLIDPDALLELLDYILNARMDWEKQRCDFLGIDVKDHSYRYIEGIYRRCHNSDEFEDEVDGKNMGVDIFEQFCIPFSKRQAEFYGGIDYYHSCGVMDNFMPLLHQNVDILCKQHVGAWTDYDKGVAGVPNKHLVLQASLHPVDEFFNGSDEHLYAKFSHFIECSNGHPVDIAPDAVYSGGKATLERVCHIRDIWRQVERDHFGDNPPLADYGIE